MRKETTAEFDAPERGGQLESRTQQVDYPTDEEPGTLEQFPVLVRFDQDNPVPVYDVSPAEVPETVAWTGTRSKVGQDAVPIASAKPGRIRLLLQNEGSGAVYIGPTAEAVKADDTAGALGFGYKLNVQANYVLEMHHNSAVWARTAQGDSATINVLEEFVVQTED